VKLSAGAATGERKLYEQARLAGPMYWMSSSIFMVDVREVLVATVPFVQVDIFHSSSEARYGVRVAGQDVDGTQLRKYTTKTSRR